MSAKYIPEKPEVYCISCGVFVGKNDLSGDCCCPYYCKPQLRIKYRGLVYKSLSLYDDGQIEEGELE